MRTNNTQITLIKRCQLSPSSAVAWSLSNWNYILTTKIWQESVYHLLSQTCRQCGLFPKSLKEKKLPSSQTSECLFKDDDALKIALPGTVAGWLTTSCSVCCASNSDKGRWTDGTETVSISHESVPSVGARWLLTLLHHTVCCSPK